MPRPKREWNMSDWNDEHVSQGPKWSRGTSGTAPVFNHTLFPSPIRPERLSKVVPAESTAAAE